MTSGRILYFKPFAEKTPGGRTKLKEFFRLLKFHIHRNKGIGGKNGLKIKGRYKLYRPVSFGRKSFIRWFSCILQNRYVRLLHEQIHAVRLYSFRYRNEL